MENLTYEALRRDPELLDRLLRNARRERAEAIRRLTSAAARALFSRPRRPSAGHALRTSACG